MDGRINNTNSIQATGRRSHPGMGTVPLFPGCIKCIYWISNMTIYTTFDGCDSPRTTGRNGVRFTRQQFVSALTNDFERRTYLGPTTSFTARLLKSILLHRRVIDLDSCIQPHWSVHSRLDWTTCISHLFSFTVLNMNGFLRFIIFSIPHLDASLRMSIKADRPSAHSYSLIASFTAPNLPPLHVDLAFLLCHIHSLYI